MPDLSNSALIVFLSWFAVLALLTCRVNAREFRLIERKRKTKRIRAKLRKTREERIKGRRKGRKGKVKKEFLTGFIIFPFHPAPHPLSTTTTTTTTFNLSSNSPLFFHPQDVTLDEIVASARKKGLKQGTRTMLGVEYPLAFTGTEVCLSRPVVHSLAVRWLDFEDEASSRSRCCERSRDDTISGKSHRARQ